MREKPYAMTVLERTAPMVAPIVITSELNVYNPNGMKLTASMKLLHAHEAGSSVGGWIRPSAGVLRAVTAIQ
jgi:hypothetical protein